MLRLLMSISLFVILSVQISSQWNTMHGEIRTDFYTIDFVNKNVGYIGGESKIARTTNGGRYWSTVSSLRGWDILSLKFADQYNGVAVGQRYYVGPGFIVKTTDSGFSWYNAYSGNTTAVNDIFQIGTEGWSVSENGNVFKASPFMGSWQFVLSLPSNLNSVFFINDSIGWTVGWGDLFKTTDGGNNWFEQQTGIDKMCYDIYFQDENRGWIASRNEVLRSTDGGAVWESIPLNSNVLSRTKFVNDTLGFITGIGKIFKTTDGGNNWRMISIPGCSRITDIKFLDEQTGFLVGIFNSLFKTNDGGDTWNSFNLGEYNNLNDIHLADPTHGVAVGENGTILRFVGDLWVSGDSPTMKRLNSVNTLDQSTAIAVGDSGVIIKSTNLYRSWVKKNSGVTVNLNSINFVNYFNGWIVGDKGTLLKSTDSGNSWNPSNTGRSNNLNTIEFINASYGWIGGNDGLILRTTDEGQSWSIHYLNEFSNILKLHFFDSNIGLALSSGGKIHRTENGGSTWTTIYDHPYYEFWDFDFLTSTQGFLCGQNGSVYITNDGGFSWNSSNTPPYLNLRTIFAIENNLIVTAGENGIIQYIEIGENVPVELISFSADVSGTGVALTWTTATEINNHMFVIERKNENKEFRMVGYREGKGTTTDINKYTYLDNDVEKGKYYYRLKQIDYDGSFEYSKEIEIEVNTANNFSLKQNYPNPFNPTTSIKYTVPSNEYVTLKVYDILGNEVATLVNEQQESGRYTVNFDGDKLSSGLYIYKIQAGKFSQVRKMLLLK